MYNTLISILDSKNRKSKITEIIEDEDKPMAIAEKKSLVEIIESHDNQSEENNDSKENKVVIEDVSETKSEVIEKTKPPEHSEKVKEELTEEIKLIEGNKIIDFDKQTVTEKQVNKSEKKMKKIPIREIPLETLKASDTPPAKAEEGKETVRDGEAVGEDKSGNQEDSNASTSQEGEELYSNGKCCSMLYFVKVIGSMNVYTEIAIKLFLFP